MIARSIQFAMLCLAARNHLATNDTAYLYLESLTWQFALGERYPMDDDGYVEIGGGA